MRISDWSSDVCSSDLLLPLQLAQGRAHPAAGVDAAARRAFPAELGGAPDPLQPQHPCRPDGLPEKPPAQAQAPPGLTGDRPHRDPPRALRRSEEHTSELQSLMRISYAVFFLKKTNKRPHQTATPTT